MGRGTLAGAWRLVLLALLALAPSADAATVTQCRRACSDEISACVASGGQRRDCRRDWTHLCRQQGLQVCAAVGDSPATGRTSSRLVISAPSSLNANAVSSREIDLGW